MKFLRKCDLVAINLHRLWYLRAKLLCYTSGLFDSGRKDGNLASFSGATETGYLCRLI
jgi:hypothetical protein